jgi:hypothetical protein
MRLIFFLAVLVVVLAGCPDAPTPSPGKPTGPNPAVTDVPKATRIEVPFVKQGHPSTCLVAAGTMLLNHRQDPTTHDELWRSVRFWNDGTSNFEIQKAIESRGFETLTFQTDRDGLLSIIRSGVPAVCSVTRSGGKHAVVVVGADAEGAVLTLHDPNGGSDESIPIEGFEQQWVMGQTMVILPEGEWLPDRIADWRNDDRIYRAREWVMAAKRDWPDDPTVSKLEHYQRAVTLDPETEAYLVEAVNLAVVLNQDAVLLELLRAARSRGVQDPAVRELIKTYLD